MADSLIDFAGLVNAQQQNIQNQIGLANLQVNQQRVKLQEANQSFDNALNARRMEFEQGIKAAQLANEGDTNPINQAMRVNAVLQKGGVGNLGITPEHFEKLGSVMNSFTQAIANKDMDTAHAMVGALQVLSPKYGKQIAEQFAPLAAEPAVENLVRQKFPNLIPEHQHAFAVQASRDDKFFKNIGLGDVDPIKADINRLQARAQMAQESGAFFVSELAPIGPFRSLIDQYGAQMDQFYSKNPLAAKAAKDDPKNKVALALVRDMASETSRKAVQDNLSTMTQVLPRLEEQIAQTKLGMSVTDESGLPLSLAQLEARRDAHMRAWQYATQLASFMENPNPTSYGLLKSEHDAVNKRLAHYTKDYQDSQQKALALQHPTEARQQEQLTKIARAQNEFAQLPTAQQTPQAAGRIGAKYNIGSEEVLKGVRDPNKPQTQITLAQESAFEKKLGEVQGERIGKGFEAAQDAVVMLDTIREGRALLQKGVITGTGAEFMTQAGKVLQQMGFHAHDDAIANTEAYMSTMAQNVGKMIKQFGSGTGLSDADREYAEKMAGGKITLTRQSLERILDLSEKASRNIIRRHNVQSKGVKTMIPMTVEEPPASSESTVAPFDDPDKERRYQEWKKQHN